VFPEEETRQKESVTTSEIRRGTSTFFDSTFLGKCKFFAGERKILAARRTLSGLLGAIVSFKIDQSSAAFLSHEFYSPPSGGNVRAEAQVEVVFEFGGSLHERNEIQRDKRRVFRSDMNPCESDAWLSHQRAIEDSHATDLKARSANADLSSHSRSASSTHVDVDRPRARRDHPIHLLERIMSTDVPIRRCVILNDHRSRRGMIRGGSSRCDEEYHKSPSETEHPCVSFSSVKMIVFSILLEPLKNRRIARNLVRDSIE